ncbi:MAG: hypothetical protein LC792_15310, partial [Actinobacteria bacterium]|nr:hypothetical protein [Actinomycetota bacterium]
PGTALAAAGKLGLEGHARRVTELMAQGRVAEADVHIAAHAALADASGRPEDRQDAAAWSTMRALLDGRRHDARAGADLVLALGREAGDPAAVDRHWALRLRLVLEWGPEGGRDDDLLDHCRRRAYRDDDLSWRSALTLLLARLGRADECRADFDAAWGALDVMPRDGAWLDLAANLAEAAAVLGDRPRAEILCRGLAGAPEGVVLTGPAWVCKGAAARFRALAAATAGRWARCDADFQAAVEVHREMAARPLLARTLHEWGRSLAGRGDLRAGAHLDESARLALHLELAGLAGAA